ncbi:hypothetical protein HELRODRAFT_142725, partial [Helobdella robusta]|uniref:Protein kinase domain-containing protein n=1 Tax=Helobdella robusta TaxID=6412 RepID=T1EJ71_HELRO
FFMEAQLMKDFDHENIVKLLGVCSKDEPYFVVMEYMLHGDLRSYLLSRRHLVSESSDESLDVSPQAITKMAMDVAQGLNYLMSIPCVHRDLACRNCLVHESGLVKIGDFGLTEKMFSSYYVRCISRKFPIRWMAPESLKDGVFSSASDIWSYGILVYEIFTFGSIPYQDKTNEEVVRHVKDGHTMQLPDACPQDLKDFCKSCWEYDPGDRQSIQIIIDSLE